MLFAWVFETKLKTHLSQIRPSHICRKECLVDRPELSSKLLKIIIPENLQIIKNSPTHSLFRFDFAYTQCRFEQYWWSRGRKRNRCWISFCICSWRYSMGTLWYCRSNGYKGHRRTIPVQGHDRTAYPNIIQNSWKLLFQISSVIQVILVKISKFLECLVVKKPALPVTLRPLKM